MAVETKSQYFFTGQGPLDTKFLVSTYDQLKSTATWAITGSTTSAAYNGMITAVNNNTADKSKNGIYFFFDPKSNARVPVDVTKDENWHKLAELADIAVFTDQISVINAVLNGSGEGADYVPGLISKVEENTDAIATITSAGYVKESELEGEVEAILTTSLQSYATVEALAEIAAKTDENSAKLKGIDTTVADAIASALSDLPTLEVTVATADTIGGIKSANGDNEVSVAEDGTASVQKVNINSLVQNDGDILILNGGNDGDPDEAE